MSSVLEAYSGEPLLEAIGLGMRRNEGGLPGTFLTLSYEGETQEILVQDQYLQKGTERSIHFILGKIALLVRDLCKLKEEDLIIISPDGQSPSPLSCEIFRFAEILMQKLEEYFEENTLDL